MRRLSLLLVGGHPADAFDNAGGTLAHHVERGDRVTVAVLTHGVRSHASLYIDAKRKGVSERDQSLAAQSVGELVDVKRQEVLAACQILGIEDVRFLYYEDDVLLLREELIQQIADIIQEVRPDIVITHHPFENAGIASTHATCAQATLHAIACASGVRRGTERPPHHVAQVFFMGVLGGVVRDSSLGGAMAFFRDVYVDITDVVERKARALDQIRSQNYAGAYARKRLECVDGLFGLLGHVAYAEPFVRYRPEVYRYLPLEETSLRRAEETTAEWMGRTCQLIACQVPRGE